MCTFLAFKWCPQDRNAFKMAPARTGVDNNSIVKTLSAFWVVPVRTSKSKKISYRIQFGQRCEGINEDGFVYHVVEFDRHAQHIHIRQHKRLETAVDELVRNGITQLRWSYGMQNIGIGKLSLQSLHSSKNNNSQPQHGFSFCADSRYTNQHGFRF